MSDNLRVLFEPPSFVSVTQVFERVLAGGSTPVCVKVRGSGRLKFDGSSHWFSGERTFFIEVPVNESWEVLLTSPLFRKDVHSGFVRSNVAGPIAIPTAPPWLGLPRGVPDMIHAPVFRGIATARVGGALAFIRRLASRGGQRLPTLTSRARPSMALPKVRLRLPRLQRIGSELVEVNSTEDPT